MLAIRVRPPVSLPPPPPPPLDYEFLQVRVRFSQYSV